MHEKYNELNTIIENLKNLSDRAHTINSLTNSLTKEFVTLNVKPCIKSTSSPFSIISELSTIIQPLSSELTLEHRVNICKNISENCFKNQVDLWQLICIIDNNTLISNIAYVNNRFSQKAYSIFKEHVSNSKGYVYQSFNEMYDAVESGLCNCCIVPIENTTDGKLLSFYSIIERFDMKISLVCDVEAEDGS